jgi:hypothetical protein
MEEIVINGEISSFCRLNNGLEGGSVDIQIEKCNVPLQNITDLILADRKRRLKVLVVLVNEE